MCTYHRKKNWCAPHFGVSERGGGGWGEPVGGFRWLWCLVVGWLACTEVLVMPEVDGPICGEAGTFQGFCLMGGPVHG